MTGERVYGDALSVFVRDPTPINAVRLAAADHKAGNIRDEQFLEQLKKAEEILEDVRALARKSL